MDPKLSRRHILESASRGSLGSAEHHLEGYVVILLPSRKLHTHAAKSAQWLLAQLWNRKGTKRPANDQCWDSDVRPGGSGSVGHAAALARPWLT